MLVLSIVRQAADIKALLQKDDLYKEVLGLQSIDFIHFDPKEYKLIAAHDKLSNDLIGIIYLVQFSNTQVALHAGIYKKYRNGKSTAYLNQCLKKLKRIVYPLHLVTTVREDNIPAVRAVDRSRFKFKKVIKINGIRYRFYVE